ncbi:MAG: hypothetical protein QG657_1771 [Acidobacteriota bacterium]|nr:hypothetical protein [Acidobacteriota bacterium]
MGNRKNNPWPVIIVYMIMLLCGVFSINLPGDAGDKWVSLSGAGSHSKEESPGLQVKRSDQRNFTVVMKTDGFFASERKENGRVFTTLHLGKYNSDMKPGYPYLPAVRQYIYIPTGKSARLKVNPGAPVSFQNYDLYRRKQGNDFPAALFFIRFVCPGRCTEPRRRIFTTRVMILSRLRRIEGKR